MTINVDVGEVYSVTLAEDETLFSVFGAQIRGEDGGPAVPQLVTSRYFPVGTVITDVQLTSVTSEVLPGTYQPLTVTAMTGDGWIGEQDLELTRIYPVAPFTWTVHEGVDQTELVLLVNPIQWNLDDGVMTAYDGFAFNITYTAPPAAGPVRVLGSTVSQPDYYVGEDIIVSVNFDADTATKVGLQIQLTDGAGYQWHYHEEVLSLAVGTSQADYAIPTNRLPAGAKYVEVLVSDSDSGQLIYGEVHNVTLNGLALMAWVDKGQYWPESDTSAELFARVRDESGALVRGLAGSFSVTVDGQPPSLAFSEPENGSYTATLPLADLRIGEHVLKLTCEDARGLRTSESLTFAYGEEYLVYLPLVLRQ